MTAIHCRSTRRGLKLFPAPSILQTPCAAWEAQRFMKVSGQRIQLNEASNSVRQSAKFSSPGFGCSGSYLDVSKAFKVPQNCCVLERAIVFWAYGESVKPMLAMFQLGFADCTAATTSFMTKVSSVCVQGACCFRFHLILSADAGKQSLAVSPEYRNRDFINLLYLSCVFGKISSHLEIFPGGCRMEVPTCSNKLGGDRKQSNRFFSPSLFTFSRFPFMIPFC